MTRALEIATELRESLTREILRLSEKLPFADGRTVHRMIIYRRRLADVDALIAEILASATSATMPVPEAA